jgi:hypothetical protein
LFCKCCACRDQLGCTHLLAFREAFKISSSEEIQIFVSEVAASLCECAFETRTGGSAFRATISALVAVGKTSSNITGATNVNTYLVSLYLKAIVQAIARLNNLVEEEVYKNNNVKCAPSGTYANTNTNYESAATTDSNPLKSTMLRQLLLHKYQTKIGTLCHLLHEKILIVSETTRQTGLPSEEDQLFWAATATQLGNKYK